MNRADALAWRQRLAPRIAPNVMDQIQAAEDAGLGVVVPGDKHWPAGLTDLGAGEPYVLWTRGAASLLGQRVGEQSTVTGARAAPPSGTQSALALAADDADE